MTALLLALFVSIFWTLIFALFGVTGAWLLVVAVVTFVGSLFAMGIVQVA